MGRFQNSMVLAKASWRVLQENRKLAVLPLLSGITTLIVAFSFLVPIAILAQGGSTNSDYTFGPVQWILTGAAYLASAYVVIFFNAALVYAADAHLHGVTVSVGDAIKFAASKTNVLLPWAIVSATVSMIIRAIEERAGIFGTIIGAIAGVAWSLVTFLVLPVLVVEGLGPFKAVKRSGELFKRAWGEQVMANFGIGLITFAAIIVGAIPAVVLMLFGTPGVIAGMVLLVLWVSVVMVISQSVQGILSMALYRYATDGHVQGFETSQLQGAFQPRRRRGFLG
jgi:hypothetical protein